MHAHRTTVIVREDQQVVVHLPDDFPAGEAEVIFLPHPTATSPHEAVAEFDRMVASLPAAPVISFDALDRGELYR
jgi:hypothetical protein